MKRVLPVFLVMILASVFVCFQIAKPLISWTFLIGRWECKKVVLAKGKDSTKLSEPYNQPYFTNYTSDLKYKEEWPEGNTVIEGQYKVDKSNNRISFINLIQTTKYPGGKVAIPDYVFKTGKEEFIVIELTKDTVILVQKYVPNSELQGDYIYYFTKVR